MWLLFGILASLLIFGSFKHNEILEPFLWFNCHWKLPFLSSVTPNSLNHGDKIKLSYYYFTHSWYMHLTNSGLHE